jgi:hypothetical protein
MKKLSFSHALLSLISVAGAISCAPANLKAKYTVTAKDAVISTSPTVLLGTRQVASSTLNDIFGSTTAVGNNAAHQAMQVSTVIQNDIDTQAVSWGGACDPYANGYAVPTDLHDGNGVQMVSPANNVRGCVQPDLSHASMVPGASTSRFAWTIRTCDNIVSADAAVRNAATQAGYPAGSSLNTPPNDALIAAAYDMFHPGVPMPDTVLQALHDLVATANTKYPNSPEAWRFLMLTLCASPSWQIL